MIYCARAWRDWSFRPSEARAGIHNHESCLKRWDCVYGFRARRCAAPRNDSEELHRFHHQGRGIRAHDLDAAATRTIGTGKPPDRVVDLHRAVTRHDRLLQGELAADEGIRAAIEERLGPPPVDAV